MRSRYIQPADSSSKAPEPLQEAHPKPPKGEEAIKLFYGDPLSYKTPDHYWRDHGAFVFVNKEAFSHVPTLRTHSGFWAHRKLKAVLEAVFKDIADQGLAPLIKTFDGCYNHRPIRGSTRLSMHSYGAAIDINAQECPLGSENRLDNRLIECFTRRGFTWGGNYRPRRDPMHFSFGEY